MVDNNTQFEIIFQKSESLEKRRQRIFLILLLLPIIFLLLKNSVIEEVNLTFFTLKQINIILVFYPSLYSTLIFYTFLLTNHNSKLIDELNYIATNEKDVIKQYEKESWLKFVQPMNILGNIFGSIKSGGFIGCLGSIIVFFPLLIFVIVYPLISLIYFIYYDYTLVNSELRYYAVSNLFFSIWTLTALIIYVKSSK